ncbi:RNA-directed DNA polymerase from mobile element jockey-like 33, partial [Homarus americanus]
SKTLIPNKEFRRSIVQILVHKTKPQTRSPKALRSGPKGIKALPSTETSERDVTNERKLPQEASEGRRLLRHGQYVPAIHPVAEPPTFAIPTVLKHKIPKETEFDHAYEVVVALELEYKNIKFSVKPNLFGDLILSPQDHNTAKILSGKTPRRKQPEWSYYDILEELPVEVIIRHLKVTKAERCVTSRDKAQTRQVLVDIKGTEENHYDATNVRNLDITNPGATKTQSHMTEMCIQKHKDGTITTAKCPNCGKKHHAWSTSCPERRERMKVAMAKVEPQNRTEAPQSTFVWGDRTKLKTPGQNQSMQETMTNQWTPQPQLQSCIAANGQNTPVLVENIILPGTLQPLQATTQLNTPKPANLQVAFTEEQIKQMITIMKVTFSTIMQKQDTSTENIIYAVMTQLTEKMQEDQTPQNSTTTSGTDDALETDIRQEEELAIQEITHNRETSSPLQQITRNRTTDTDRQQTHDHRQERQHPEERRKNSRDSTSCASLRAGAQETATTPNGRGGERLDHERREQLQHQRRLDNDRIAPPPCNLKITQWNVQGLSNKRHTVQAAAIAKNIDVFILQETLMSKDKQFRLPGYQQYSVPKGPNSHGSMILVRATISSSEVEPVHCGDGVEAQAVRIHLANGSLVVYNIYKPPTKRLEAGELLTQATQELVLIAGDFNAHHPTINSTPRMNLDGHHLVELLTDVPEITLINTGEPTHILRGTLDLTFISTELVPVAQWEINDELTSDHFATTTTLRMELLSPPPRPPPRWNTKKANWKLYQDELQKWYSNYELAEDIDQLNQYLTGAIQHAAEKSIPKTNPTNRHHKNYWFYNDEVREQNHRINTFRRHLRQYPSPEGVKLLRAAVQHARQITKKIREDKWLEWCASFNAHTSLSELWRKLRIATGKLPRSPAHPQPLQEANRLAEHFAERSSSAQLPPEIRLHLQQVQLEREVVVRHAIEQADTTDCLFTIEEIRRARKTSKDTAPGSDALNLDRDVFNKKTWLLCSADAVNRLKLKDTILSKGPDTISPDYSTPAPRESPPAVFNILQTGTRKADCNPHELRQIAERNMKALTPHNSTVYYTDGCVETTSTKAGAAFTIEGGNTSLWRTSDGCSKTRFHKQSTRHCNTHCLMMCY